MYINCPFDDRYRPNLDAIVLVTVAHEFTPTMAFTVGPPSATRIDRIRAGILDSALSIHDLSRNIGEGPYNLARMNMPLELGMAMMRAHVAEREPDFGTHEWLALVPPNHDEDLFVSNLRAYDLHAYDGADIEQLIGAVAGFLNSRSAVDIEPRRIADAYGSFHDAADKARATWGPTPAWWVPVVRLAAAAAEGLLS